ncbi:MAG: hypothetical protein A3F11_04730 [Gammaproteobacteria bacterium RIFCSPHIGHO2_12_FULL_37_14]|nr:MAG: hypothetical protein A3F11_04730 [Gammaproteobacteria bacterium RIFCSPHIGHO2_12_FULL_37_14]
MAVRQAFKISRKTFFNPRAWFGYDSLKEDNKTIWVLLAELFSPPGVVREETFEEAMQRLNLSEKDLQLTARNYYLYALFFVVLGSSVLVYAFYLMIQYRLFWAWLLAMSIASLFYANAFRYHFWFFQIKHRKLGCTFAEWRAGKPLRE